MKKSRVILIVDDDKGFLEEIHALLCEKDYTVITCADAEQALLLVHNYLPDHIILDLAMPHFRGEDILSVLSKRHPHIPVMICTGVPNIETDHLRQSGASEVFQKPFSPDALFRALDRTA
jgi:DNA-binding NtrC family response regulator